MTFFSLLTRLDRRALGVSLVCMLSLWPLQAWAEARGKGKRVAVTEEVKASSDALQRAEEALQRGELPAAISAFLQADREDRNMATLVRAFEAAGQLDDALLIVHVAERILSRSEVSDEGRTLARRAVARASDRLTQLELVCAERPCSFRVDGLEAPEGISYWNPGAHEVQVVSPTRPDADQSERDQPEQAKHVTCAARAICRLTLPAADDGAAHVAVAAIPARADGLVARSQELARGPERFTPRRSEPHKTASRGPVAFLVSSSVAAAVLVGLATWTGTRAVQARNLHGGDDPHAYDANSVRTLARRTDYLFLGAALSAGAAAAAAIWWVDWDARRRTSVSLDAGASLKATHHF